MGEGIQIKELAPEMHPNQRVGPGHHHTSGLPTTSCTKLHNMKTNIRH